MNFNAFLRRLGIWLLPVIAVWFLITPFYNLFLITATNNLLKISESPNETSVKRHDRHHLLVYRSDLRLQTSTGHVGSMRVTDVQFNWILTAALFLATPGLSLRKRLQALGYATLILVFFHLFLMFFWVKFILATQLGEWSAANFSTFWQNFWGLGKHLLDLPFKFAMPLALWVAFFYEHLRPKEA